MKNCTWPSQIFFRVAYHTKPKPDPKSKIDAGGASLLMGSVNYTKLDLDFKQYLMAFNRPCF